MLKANKGQVSYGESVGILLLETFTPFIPGDVGNATTYQFPVRFQRIEGFTFDKLLQKDPKMIDPILEAGHQLVKEGVKAITGDCGYLAMYQDQIADELNVPVFMSSLLQLPFMSSMLRKNEKIGIVCSHADYFEEDLLKNLGIKPSVSLCIEGMEDQVHFSQAAHEEKGQLDPKQIENEVVSVVQKMVKENPEVKMILLECSSLPPYAGSIQDAVGLPVFDYITMINYVHSTLVRKPYIGFM
ncbi:aspartate/glutamate racemase family protein [Texcoconibacillus texcoconensis]|nr:aspartate/glutamate racemase family protein [Texcoconibacillus texcoconensis]